VSERGTRAWLAWLARMPELYPALLALGVIVFWTAADGAVNATDSYPGGVILLGLLAATAYAFRAQIAGMPRLVLVAFGLLAAFVAWNFLSITWADDQGAAWDGANRALFYLTVFAIFAIPPWRTSAAAILLGAYALAIAVLGALNLLGAASSDNPLSYFVAQRFASPLGYHNADAAAFTMAIFPALFLASRRETPWPIRGLMLASAGVLFELALLPQSRGWLLAAPIGLLAYLVLVPRLGRNLITLAPLAIVCAVAAPTMLDVFDTVNNGGALPHALDDARSAMLVSAAVLFVAGALIGVADRLIALPERTIAILDRVVLVGAGIVAVVGAVVAISVIGNPVNWANDRWQDFKSGEFEHSFSGSRLGQGLGSNRYDFWRVAVDEMKDHPLVGVGTENFAEDYVQHRHSTEEPTHPHNLPLRVLAQTGLIGFGLFAGFFVTALIGVGRVRLRSPDWLSRGVAGVAGAVFVYWLIHSSGDWFWAFPAVTAPVFVVLGIGVRLDADRVPAPAPFWNRWALPATVGAAVVALIAAVSLFLPWAAAIDVQKASADWPANPNAAFDKLNQASDLDFLSARPDVVEGVIAVRLGDQVRARAAFERALERDPRNWYATLELAAIDALQGDKQAATRHLDRVSELNPREGLTAMVRQGLESGHPVTLQALDAALVGRYCSRLGRVPGPNGCRTR
jgi:hypothetical protein